VVGDLFANDLSLPVDYVGSGDALDRSLWLRLQETIFVIVLLGFVIILLGFVINFTVLRVQLIYMRVCIFVQLDVGTDVLLSCLTVEPTNLGFRIV
jgi:hypothetical protein